jgi:hypothetical protein
MMREKYDPGEYREGMAARLRTQITTARALLDAIEGSLEAGTDVAYSAEALSTTADRILESAAVLRALGVVRWSP